MEFIIQNIGWFVGIGLVLLFALIGYFADSREQKKLNSNIKNNNLDNNVQNENSESVVQNSYLNDNNMNNYDNNFNYGDVNTLKDEAINNNSVNFVSVSEENLSNNSNVLEDQFKNIEETNMSLEDLEKKNYSDILNTRNVSGYSYVDDNEISDYVDSNGMISDVDDYQINLVNNEIVTSIDEDETLNSEVITENNLASDISVPLDNINDDSISSSENIVSKDEVNQIDQVNSVDNSIDVDDVPTSELFNSEVNLNSSVPELSSDVYNVNVSENENGVLDLDDDSIDDDIWKF